MRIQEAGVLRGWLLVVCLVVSLWLPTGLHAQVLVFRPMEVELLGVQRGDIAWGDLDGDGDYDVVITGESETAVFHNDGDETFVDDRGVTHYVTNYEQLFDRPFEGFQRAMVELGDVDGDGDLDILVAGRNENGSQHMAVYVNPGTGRRFDDRGTRYAALHSGDMDLGDFDNDGDLDVVMLGLDETGEHRTILLENRFAEGQGFVGANAGLRGLAFGTADWGDYDNDGDLDLLLAGHAQPQAFVTTIYRNDGDGVFTDVGGPFEAFLFPSAAWGDYDSDGDLDVLLNGGKLSPFILEGRARVYRNDDGVFTAVGAVLPGGYAGDAAWGDFNNDGRLDALVMGGTFPVGASTFRAYANRGGGSFELVPGLGGRIFGRARWGDYDHDGDLDVLAVGRNADGMGIASEYRNELNVPNTPPEVPDGLEVTVEEGSATLHWQPATDPEAPSPGLTYNLRVGTAPGASDVVSPMADIQTGYRFISGPGNVGHTTSWTLRGLESGSYYWSVQAIDQGFGGSAFAAEGTFGTGDPDDTTPPAAPTGLMARGDDGEVQLSWTPNPEPDLARYLVFRGLEPGPTTHVATVPSDTTTYRDVDVINDTTYYYRVQAQDESGNTSAFSDEVQVTPNPPFTEVDARLPGYSSGDLAWGDYDGDGDLDLVLVDPPDALIYRNDDGDFANANLELSAGTEGSIDWGDYDGDGDTDLVVGGAGITRVYRNNGGTFNVLQTLPGAEEGSVDWGDYDGDGDLDLLLAGRTSTNAGEAHTGIYRNDGDSFAEISVGLAGIVSGAATWGDYDGDGDLDVAVAGFAGLSGDNQALARVYRNDGESFTDIEAGLEEQSIGEVVAWADYDTDGDLDLLLGTNQETLLYQNDDGVFNVTGFGFPPVRRDAEWGDYDGDGDPDLIVAGRALYRNDQSAFVLVDVSMTPGDRVDWGDYDGDGDLDFIIGVGGILRTRIYRNNRITSSVSRANASR